MKNGADERLVTAIYEVLVSPNVPDSNGEPANVVDALASIANGLHDVANAIREHGA